MNTYFDSGISIFQKKLEASYDVNHAIHNCFKDPLDVRQEGDPRNHPENLEKELQKVNEWYMLSVSKSRSDAETDQVENSLSNQLAGENVDLDEKDKLEDPRKAEEDENDENFDGKF